MPCILDYFPLEILHTIFDYLKPIDLLNAFIEINPYLDNILYSYSRIQLNFKSIKKSLFYFICEHIHPEQIQSLVLSDDESTPDQVKLFTSLIPLIKCINLQSITISQITDATLLSLMFSHIENHQQIHSLSVDSYSIYMSKKLSRTITETLLTLPALKHLTVMSSSALISLRQPLPKLTHLTIRSCAYNDLQIILHGVPNLIYLHISVPYGEEHMPIFDSVPSHLTSLLFELQRWTTFTELDNFLSLTPFLKRLKLQTMGGEVLLNGSRWETLIKTKLPHLIEFALDISPEENNMTVDDVLIPFKNRFWLTEKHWHMGCLISTVTLTCLRLFSVPYFSPASDWYPTGDGFINYSVDNYSFNDNLKELRVAQFPTEISMPLPFKNIQTLSLECTADDISQLQKVVNLISIKHLKFGSSVQCTWFPEFLQITSNISQLTLKRKALLQITNSLINNQQICEQIKMLHVKDIIFSTDIDQTCQAFPKLERVSLLVREREDILPVFDKFHNLISTRIHWSHPYSTSLSIMDEFIQENNICSDGTYWFHGSSLSVWND